MRSVFPLSLMFHNYWVYSNPKVETKEPVQQFFTTYAYRGCAKLVHIKPLFCINACASVSNIYINPSLSERQLLVQNLWDVVHDFKVARILHNALGQEIKINFSN